MKSNWIAVDWGTTNFRAFLMSDTGECIDKIDTSKGLLSVEDGCFPLVFDSLIKPWIEEFKHLPIIMAGMVGSQQGWLNIPYVDAPVSIDELIKNSRKVNLVSGGVAKIIPGVRCKNNFGMSEVMRGEEVQLIGLSELIMKDFTAILYGTHSKHATWCNGKLDHYETIMTGELYSILVNYSILGKSLPNQCFDQDVFIKGVGIGSVNPLNHVLFSARTMRLFNEIDNQFIHCYISGLLIGHELKYFNRSKYVYLVGSKMLSLNYSMALEYLNINFEYIDGEKCFLKGMNKIYNSEVNNEQYSIS